MDKDSATTVESIMTPAPLDTASSSKTAFDIATQMKEKNRGGIVIIDNDSKPIGIITERDIVRKIVSENKDPKSILVSDVMSTPLITVGPEAYVSDAALIMTKYNVRRLPIVRDNRLIGIVTTTDFARVMYEKTKKDRTLTYMSKFPLLEHFAA